jgi:hypothetical protein
MEKSPIVGKSTLPPARVSPLVLLGIRDLTVVPTKGHRVIKQGISSQVLGSVSEYLGVGKGALAEFMDLDRGTASGCARCDRRFNRRINLPRDDCSGQSGTV